MPSLLERAKTVESRVTELGRIGVERGNYEKLKTRAEQVHKQADSLRVTASSVVRIRANAISVDSLPNASQELRRRLVTLHETLTQDPQVIANDSQFLISFLNPLQAHTEKLRASVLALWKSHVDSIVPKIAETSLEVLSNAGFSSQVVRLRQLREELGKLRESMPASDDVFSKLEKLAKEMERVWSELKGVPAAVMSFLSKATQANATFADLTPEVEEWLDKRKLIPQLRIGLR